MRRSNAKNEGNVMQEHSFHKEGSDLGGSPRGRKSDTGGQTPMGTPVLNQQMETDYRDKTIQSFAENILRLGNECRALADENKELKSEVERLEAEVEALMTTPTSRLLRAERKENDRLKAEVERSTAWGRGLESDLSHARVEISFLKSEVERLRASSFVTAVPVEQYERLRKAGDAMQKRLYVLENPTHPEVYLKLLSAWNAAKEGKPSV